MVKIENGGFTESEKSVNLPFFYGKMKAEEV